MCRRRPGRSERGRVAEHLRRESPGGAALAQVAPEEHPEQRPREHGRAVGADDGPHDRSGDGRPPESARGVGQRDAAVEADETGENRRPVPDQHVERRDPEVGPADEAEDPPPVRSELDPARGVDAPVGEGHEDEESDARRTQPGLPEASPAVVRHSPDEQDPERHEHVPHGGGEHAAHPVLGVDHEDAHHDQGQGPRGDVAPDLEPGLAAAQPSAERERDGDPDDEQEGREDEVGDGHAVGVGGLVKQEGRRPGDPRHLVHEQHEEDVGAAEQVDREDAGLGGLPGRR